MQLGDNHHMLVRLPELRPCFTSLPVAGRWGGRNSPHHPWRSLHSPSLHLYSLYHSALMPLPVFFLSLSTLSFSFAISFSLTLSLFSVFEVFPDPIATYGERERESGDSLREEERRKERGNTLHDQSGVTRGWVLQGGWWWGLRNIWQIFL